ncbi:MAG TPA: transglutaminase family protein [Candidatus Binataceae bacterium]|nr:transglutaminase family protein [Candidatus Binataceae bacterium]
MRAIHTTEYTYGETVSICYTEARLAPRSGRGQRLLEHELMIEPAPDSSVARKDYFGNAVTAFSIQQPHRVLRITAKSVVDTPGREAIHPGLTPAWEQVRAAVRRHDTYESFDAFQFVFESPRVAPLPEFAEYAAPSFPAGRPMLECALDLCHRIHADFKYDTGATTVTTPVDEALREHHGVCQDFAHVMIACVRSLGLPARYVSGYLQTGGDAVGAHASHAWVAVYCPGFGWLDLDPTNDVMPSSKHVTLGWGRDYSDVPPVNGVALGGGDQEINVEVHVTPLAPSAVKQAE